MSSLPVNPFADVDLSSLSRLAAFEVAFSAWIGHRRGTSEARLGELLISAIIFGGLASPRCWQPWLDALINNQMNTRDDVVSIPYAIQDDCNSDRSLHRRWFADPITTALLLRHPTKIPRLPRSIQIRHVIDMVRASASLGSESHEEFLGWFEPALALSLRLRIPAVLAEQALLIQEGHSPGPRVWASLGTCSPVSEYAENKKHEFLTSLPKESRIASTNYKTVSYSGIHEKHLNAVYTSIVKRLPGDGNGQYQVGNRRVNASAVRAGVGELHNGSLGGKPVNVREAILGLIFRLASSKPKDPRPRLGMVTLGTLLNYIRSLAKADWQNVWMASLLRCEPRGLFEIFSKVIEAGVRDGDGSAYGVIRLLDTYICHHWPHIESYWGEVVRTREREVRNPAVEMVSGQQFARILALLNYHPAGARDAHMCRLASTLMFRAGLRGQQEVRYLRIGDIEQFGNLVELTVRTNADVATKTRTSYRRIPLDILLEPAELRELLDWRARRIIEGRGQSLNSRLFDDIDGSGDGLVQARLLAPIELAIAVVIGAKLADRLANRKWTLGGALRHSFCSYLLCTLLLPDDQGVLSLPEGVGTDLVSSQRRSAVADRLMGDGSNRQTAVHAVSTLMGHAHVSRLLNVYAHLMDWSLASCLWRWSVQRAVPAELVQRLVLSANPRSTLSLHGIRKTSQRRCKGEANHLTMLGNGDPNGQIRTTPPVRSKPRAAYGPSTPCAPGSAYVDHFRDDLFGRHRGKGRPTIVAQRSTPQSPSPPALPEMEKIDQIDAVMNLARRGVAPPEIASFLQVDVASCEMYLARAAKLSSLKRGKLSRFPALARLIATTDLGPIANDASPALLPASFRAGMLIVDQDAIARAALVKFLDKAQFGSVGFRTQSHASTFLASMVRLGVPGGAITLEQTHARAGSMGVATSADLEGRRFVVRVVSRRSSGPSDAQGSLTIYGLALIAIGSAKIDIERMSSWSPPPMLKRHIG